MKTLNIQLKDDVYERVVNEANNVDRSIRNMVSVLVEMGLNCNDQQPQAEVAMPILNGMDVDTRVDSLYSKFEEVKRKKQEHPRLQAIKAELSELGDQLEGETSPTKANELMIRIQELQKEANAISDELNK